MNKKESNFIKKYGVTLDEAFDDYIKKSDYSAGCPMDVVYFDRETKLCLVVNEYNVYGLREKEDDFALKIIKTHPDRFVNLSNAISINDFDLMTDFASEMRSDKLFRALEAKRPMVTFNNTACALGLFDKWEKFRDEFYAARLQEFCDDNDIKYNFK